MIVVILNESVVRVVCWNRCAWQISYTCERLKCLERVGSVSDSRVADGNFRQRHGIDYSTTLWRQPLPTEFNRIACLYIIAFVCFDISDFLLFFSATVAICAAFPEGRGFVYTKECERSVSTKISKRRGHLVLFSLIFNCYWDLSSASCWAVTRW